MASAPFKQRKGKEKEKKMTAVTVNDSLVDVSTHPLEWIPCTVADRIMSAMSKDDIVRAFLIPITESEVPYAAIAYPYVYRDGKDIHRETTDGWYVARRHTMTEEAVQIVGTCPEKISHLYIDNMSADYWASMHWSLTLRHPVVSTLDPTNKSLATAISAYGSDAESASTTMCALTEIVEDYDAMISTIMMGEYGDHRYYYDRLLHHMRGVEGTFCPVGSVPAVLSPKALIAWLAAWRVPNSNRGLNVPSGYTRFDACVGAIGGSFKKINDRHC